MDNLGRLDRDFSFTSLFRKNVARKDRSLTQVPVQGSQVHSPPGLAFSNLLKIYLFIYFMYVTTL